MRLFCVSKNNHQCPIGVVILSLIATVLQAQGGARLRGVVTDSIGSPIAGVRVELLGTGRRTLSDETGTFIIDRVAPGAAQLRFTRLGYRPHDEQVTVEVGESRLAVVQIGRAHV